MYIYQRTNSLRHYRDILIIALSILVLFSCSSEKILDGIWVSNDNKSLLEIKGDQWKFIYSEVSSLCTIMRVKKNLGNSGVLELISPKGMDVENPTNYYVNEYELSVFDNKYSKETIAQWDSILVFKSIYDNTQLELINKYVFDSSSDNDLLATLILVSEVELIHPSNTSTDYIIKYELWFDNQIVGSKMGGSNILCVP